MYKKFFIFFFIIATILSMIIAQYVHIGIIIAAPIFLLIITIYLLPIIALALYIYKKNLLSKKNLIITVSIIIYLYTLTTNLIEFFFLKNTFFSTNGICYICYFILFPSIILTILTTPKEKFAEKKIALITTFVITLLGCATSIGLMILNEKQIQKLKIKQIQQYSPYIEKIETYKKINKIYPDNINDYKINNEYRYEIKNNGQDFVLSILQDPNNMIIYRYCSDIELEECKKREILMEHWTVHRSD